MKTTPYLKNINSDPQMTGMFKKVLKEGENVIGKETKELKPDVRISGVGIANRHCTLMFDASNKVVMAHPNQEDPA